MGQGIAIPGAACLDLNGESLIGVEADVSPYGARGFIIR